MATNLLDDFEKQYSKPEEPGNLLDDFEPQYKISKLSKGYKNLDTSAASLESKYSQKPGLTPLAQNELKKMGLNPFPNQSKPINILDQFDSQYHPRSRAIAPLNRNVGFPINRPLTPDERESVREGKSHFGKQVPDSPGFFGNFAKDVFGSPKKQGAGERFSREALSNIANLNPFQHSAEISKYPALSPERLGYDTGATINILGWLSSLKEGQALLTMGKAALAKEGLPGLLKFARGVAFRALPGTAKGAGLTGAITAGQAHYGAGQSLGQSLVTGTKAAFESIPVMFGFSSVASGGFAKTPKNIPKPEAVVREAESPKTPVNAPTPVHPEEPGLVKHISTLESWKKDIQTELQKAEKSPKTLSPKEVRALKQQASEASLWNKVKRATGGKMIRPTPGLTEEYGRIPFPFKSKDGIPGDEVASMIGFKSENEMLQEISKQKPISQQVREAQADHADQAESYANDLKQQLKSLDGDMLSYKERLKEVRRIASGMPKPEVEGVMSRPGGVPVGVVKNPADSGTEAFKSNRFPEPVKKVIDTTRPTGRAAEVVQRRGVITDEMSDKMAREMLKSGEWSKEKLLNVSPGTPATAEVRMASEYIVAHEGNKFYNLAEAYKKNKELAPKFKAYLVDQVKMQMNLGGFVTEAGRTLRPNALVRFGKEAMQEIHDLLCP